MNVNSFWPEFWRWVLIVGLTFYFIIAIAVVPWGFMDIRRLFAKLDKGPQPPAKDDFEI